MAETKSCPVCAETIKSTARKCIHCNEFIDFDSRRGCWPRWTGFGGKTLWEWMTVLIFPALLGAAGIWVARAQYEFEVGVEQREQATAVAGVTATSLSNVATIEAGVALQSTQAAQRTATVAVVTAEAKGTEAAVAANANVREAEASGNQRSINAASADATVQAQSAEAAVLATTEAINANAAAEEATQSANNQATAEARATADALSGEATVSAVTPVPVTIVATPIIATRILTVTATLTNAIQTPTLTSVPPLTQTVPLTDTLN